MRTRDTAGATVYDPAMYDPSAMLSIRVATRADAGAISALRREVAREAYAAYDTVAVRAWADERHGERWLLDECFGTAEAFVLVIEDGGTIVGSAYATLGRKDHGADAYMGGLYLRPALRGRRYGSVLVERRFAWLRARGARCALAESSADNAAALCLLSRHGFVERGRFDFDPVPGLVWVSMTARIGGQTPPPDPLV